ncbi:unnamed protein product [Phytophthora lilii]|uniref:Unnamed protein product n=1 Tax=Phytophthora lilii TaxID=2077276 RepID=A0A9W6TFX2_9STRA|nr:unnamed protein product [Phytophthora lilii]
MVREILREAEEQKEEVELEKEDLDDAALPGDKEKDDNDKMEERVEGEEVVSGGAERTRREAPFVALPLLTTMSPRTRRGLSKLPPPSEAEMREIESFERSVDHPEFYQDFYRELKQTRVLQAQRQSTVKEPNQRNSLQILPRSSSVAPSLRKAKRPRAAIKPLKTRKVVDAQPANLSDVVSTSKEVSEQSIVETIRDNFTHTSTRRTSNRLSQSNKLKQSRSYNRLVQERQNAKLQNGIAECQVKETIDGITQWIPLDVVYAFGLGKSASPAQQRATEVLFRVGLRLKSQLLVIGLRRWKEFVIAMQEQEWDLATIRLQCWWRQIRARREITIRRRIRKELQRRQEALLALLATKQQQAACRITRSIRRYAVQRSRERAIARQKAAICIQKFWRQRCTEWVALRRELLRQQRNNAAVCIQKHARRILAQRRRILLSKIRHVDNCCRQKALQVAARAKDRKMLGAAISIQRAFRNWQQTRVLMLRRRRAAFERDKKKILKVQAHYRGQQARRWVNKHRSDIRRSVLVLQCSWRCYCARKELRRRKKQALSRCEQLLKEIEDERRRRKANTLVPIQLQKKLGQISLLKATNVFQPNDAAHSREVQSARKLQARWRGRQIRKRLRYEKAKEVEKTRREVNRRRRLAAVCIQRRLRGIRGRAYAWRMMQERSAMRIQRVWRGYQTRIQLLKVRYAIKMINRIQAHWKARRNIKNQRFRALNAATIQRAARRYIGRRMLNAAFRRRQFLSEERAVGKIFEEKTRNRVKDELLLQSFSFKMVKLADEMEGGLQEDSRVDRSLYIVDQIKKLWRRKGYDGIWQEVFRNASGNSFEMDNSHFARFLKALPHAFIHKTQFPMQNADVIFAKMKEPKAKSISFPRFNKAILMLLNDRFADVGNSKESSKGSEHVDTGSDFERYLRFMNRYVLPSTIQNGKYRKMLEVHCTKRLLWSAAVLRRFAIRIATKKKHDEFVIIFRDQQIQKHRGKCASKIQLAYRCYKFRLQLKAMLASMFIEFIDHTGRSVRFQHIASGKILTKRPIFLRGVTCGKIVPLPFPGEEFHAYCERHEDSTHPNASKIPAEVYCVECEDAMCKVCFDRDHKTRHAFQRHQPRKIQKCSHCCSETATRECLQCGNGKVPFCDPCFPHVHKPLLKHANQETFHKANEDANYLADEPNETKHKFHSLVVMCAECSDRVAQWSCETCLDLFCKRCMSSYHAKGQRQHHHCRRLNYFSVLRQKAEQKRDADAEKEREKRKRQREEERKRLEAELRQRNLAATKIQALIRSFVARQSGKAYMRLVRQTQAARAQRKKDDKVRSSIVYKVKAVLGISPDLKSDTKQEIVARKQRFEDIKRTLFLQRRPMDKSKAKKRWSKKQKARAMEAARTWLDYDGQVKILKGEWKKCVGSIVSTQNLMLTGSVLVFIPLANRSVVVRWEDIEPYDQDEALRQAYEPPSQVALNITRDFHAKISRILEAAIRKARLLYLQTIEFNRIMQYAWVVEYDKREQKVEYWNVVLNRRVATPPKAMQLIERMEPEDREKLEKRVELARSKLVALLNPFQPKDKPKLAMRRNGIVFVPSGIIVEEDNTSLAALKHEMEAVDGARFWHDKVIPNRQFGGKKARKFLATSPSKACWSIVKLFSWMDLHEDGGFEPHAKKLLNLTEEMQVYVVREVSNRLESSGDVKLARDKLFQLMNLKEATLQLLVTKDQRDAEEEEARQAQ